MLSCDVMCCHVHMQPGGSGVAGRDEPRGSMPTVSAGS